MNNEGIEGPCSGRSCTWGAKDGDVGCSGGNASCFNAHFLEADESVFHDKDLINATTAMKAILELIPAKAGRKLSFVNTNMGTLLAWVTHDMEITDDAVTHEHDDAKITNALGLKNIETKGATTAY